MLMQILTVYFISGAHKGLTGIVLSRSKKDKYYWVTIGATLPSLRVELPRWYTILTDILTCITHKLINLTGTLNYKVVITI